uniref:Secreted protein n=1 Tax=Haemonchus contortus TaxID=6289 RepID=A0A7I5E6S5_HAECO
FYNMTSTRTIILCIILVVIQACAEENGKVVKQVMFSRNMPAWRSSMRIRQIQGNFPRLSSFFDGGSRPQLFHHFNKRNLDLYDASSLEQ